MKTEPTANRGKLAILVGGGPAPGINGVISAATIEGINQGYRVLGVRDGYKYLAKGDTEHCVRLSIESVKGIHLRGGSILGTSRTNPTKSEASMQNVLDEDPPFVAGSGENGYDESLATIKGRFWYVQLKKRF